MEELLLVIVQFDKEGGRIVTEFFPFLNPFSCKTSFDSVLFADDGAVVVVANKLLVLLILLVMSVFLVFLIRLVELVVIFLLLFCSDLASRVLLEEIIPHSLAPPPLALLLFLAFTTADKATITFSLLLLTLLLLLDGFLMAVEIGVVVMVAMVQVLFVGNIPTELLLLP